MEKDHSMRRIAVVFPSSMVKKSDEEMARRVSDMEDLGFRVTSLSIQHKTKDGTTAGKAVERAAMLSHALTQRRFDVVWAARGGYGTTSLLPYLRNMLPPVLPEKTVVGFSDVSFLGVMLALQYPSITYVHANNFYSDELLTAPEQERKALMELVCGRFQDPVTFPIAMRKTNKEMLSEMRGVCVPMNLSLAESLASVNGVTLPENTILFIEEINERVYQILRKLDSLANSGLLDNVSAVVVGSFSSCTKADGTVASEQDIVDFVAERTRLPVFSLPIFGHDRARFPLVCFSEVVITNRPDASSIQLSFTRSVSEKVADVFKPAEVPAPGEKGSRIHFTGIGGTGMASVAGIFKSAGYSMTGSDTPIYPPMDKQIADMGVTPYVGYNASNIPDANPDTVVLSNVISRQNAQLQGNPELETILENDIPMLSFPSALRRFFLSKSRNIVVTGTHGKTTTTSLIAHTLQSMGLNPSLFVGGAPKNFKSGFALGARDLFVLEGDEYDTAFFDKGPKFMHYEPTVALLNNIEFDHADIYDTIEAIELEFLRLAKHTKARGGVVVANLLESRVRNVVEKSGAVCLAFGTAESQSEYPTWKMLGMETLSTGTLIRAQAPGGQIYELKTQVFGRHNALNFMGALASIHAYLMLRERRFAPVSREDFEALVRAEMSPAIFAALKQGLETFAGVKRRFELVAMKKDVAIFDDFAHHPTAIASTLDAFRSYQNATGRTGRIIACFDPRNATMRRRVLQDDLAHSFGPADVVFIGQVPKDLRIAEQDRLDGPGVATACGPKASYFDDNGKLCDHLASIVKPMDTVVFMGPSGAFAGLPQKLAGMLDG